MGHKWEIEAKLPRNISEATRKQYGSYMGKRYFGSKAEAISYVNGLVDDLGAMSRRYEYPNEYGDLVESHIVGYFDAEDVGNDTMLADLHEFDFVIEDGIEKLCATGQLVVARFNVKQVY